MAWRLPRKQWEQGKGKGNRKAFRRIVKHGDQPGVLAYHEGQPIGWCSVAPRQVYLTLERSRVLKPVDDRPVWSISCLFIARPYRRQGVSVQLLRAAVKFARSQGATIVEGYPVEAYAARMPDAFAWTGLVPAYRKAGFREAVRRSKSRPIMRKKT